MKLLLADDDPDFREMIIQTAPAWLEVVACSSSQQAIQIMSVPGDVFDLALIDVHMDPHLATAPYAEGTALVRWMREHGSFFLVVLVSSYASRPSRPSESDAGAIGFLRKPLDLPRLYGFLDAYRQLFGVSATTDKKSASGVRTGE